MQSLAIPLCAGNLALLNSYKLSLPVRLARYIGPSSPKNASRSLRRALLMLQVNTGPLYRGGKGT